VETSKVQWICGKNSATYHIRKGILLKKARKLAKDEGRSGWARLADWTRISLASATGRGAAPGSGQQGGGGAIKEKARAEQALRGLDQAGGAEQDPAASLGEFADQ
jgi:hypothetical protein